MSTPQSYRNRTRGVVAVLTVVMLTMLLGFAALTVDVGYMYNVRGELQHAVDASALAGASALGLGSRGVRDRASAFAADNYAGGGSVRVHPGDIQIGDWNAATGTFTPLSGEAQLTADAVRVTARLTSATGNAVPLFFAQIFGQATADVSASATAQFGTAKAWDMVIVQDKSGSFTSALSLAKEADASLLECLRDHTDNASQVGFVAYTGTAEVVAPLQPLATGFSALELAIDNLSACCRGSCRGGQLKCNTGTNIAAGIDAAIDELLGSRSAPEIGRAMVIVSDGRPQSTRSVSLTDAELRAMAIASADDAAANGISIFTVYYAGSSSTPGADALFLEALIRGEGTFSQTPIADELSTLVWRVCASLPLMLVE